MKLNVDRSRSVDGKIAAGGLPRFHQGTWIAGFQCNLGRGSVFDSEDWSIYKGILLARDCGVKNLVIETDAKEVVDLINSHETPSHFYESLLEDIKKIMGLFSSCII